jgi:hypothetical protein
MVPSESPESTAPEVIGVDFELTPEEWVEVGMQHSWRSKPLRQARRTVRGLLVAIFVLLALLGLVQGSTLVAVTWLLGGAVVVAALDPLLRGSQRNQLRKLAATGIANGTFGPHRVELTPAGMLDSTSGYDWLTRWPAIERVEEGEGAFLIYTGPNACLPIPHSAFRDAPALRRFADAFYALREQGTRGVDGAGGSPHPSLLRGGQGERRVE